jgi:hypothetical protein
MINVIKTLKKLHKNFPNLDLDQLLGIVDTVIDSESIPIQSVGTPYYKTTVTSSDIEKIY